MHKNEIKQKKIACPLISLGKLGVGWVVQT